MPLIPLIISILAGALGNVLMKMGSKTMPEGPLAIFTSPLSLLGIAFLISSFPFYSLVIQKLPLNIAFPVVTSSTFILVVLISYFLLKEPLTFVNILGILLLIAGLFLAAQR